MTYDIQETSDIKLPNEEVCWQAVLSRDTHFDGRFVYCVQSTGIYCRPVCPSRRPRRDRVAYALTPASAEAAGYRPCSRCRPQTLDQGAQDRALIEELCSILDADSETTHTLESLAALVGREPHRLRRLFTRIMGISPRDFAAARRFERLRGLLRDGEPVAGALYEAGFGSSSRLYESAGKHLGMTPATYRKGGVGEAISYAVSETEIGFLLAAQTAKGVAAIYLGDDAQSLERELAAEYPRASLTRDDAALGSVLDALVAYLDGTGPHPALPLDLKATAFQWQVWQALMKIPYGETRTYKQVAETIGKPKAVRAVGRACGLNPVSLTIPCHRVVGSGGSLHGYRWGLERKKTLLEMEAVQPDSTEQDSTC